MLCVLKRIASMRRFLLVHTTYFYFEANRKDGQIMLLDLALKSTLIGSNYSCLEQIFIVPKMFEPLKFDCISRYTDEVEVLVVVLV